MSPENKDLDQILAGIREEAVDPALVESAAARVRTRLSHAALRSCADFQALMPDYRAGCLPEARALLVKDHTRECVACRKALEGPSARVVAFSTPRRVAAMPWFRWAMAAGVAGIAVAAGWGLLGIIQTAGSRTVVQAANGLVYRVTAQGPAAVSAGAELSGGGEIRTAKDSGAVVKLGDGSLVEMRERSAFSVSRAGRDLTVHLQRGSIIVQAAKRRSGHLYVATRDCRVAVTGTVFSVNSGVKGSRVSVIEGEVHVAQGGQEKVLRPGDQYATSASIGPAPVSEEISWSRNFDSHMALLREFSVLEKKLAQVHMPEARYASRLVGMLPADTVVFAAIPNLGRTLGEAQEILRQRVAESPALQEWWNQKMKSGAMDKAVDEIRAVGEYLGDEIVIAAATGPDGTVGSPVFLAEVKRPGLREHVQRRLEEAGAGKGLRVADSLEALAPAGGGDAQLFVGQDLVAASPNAAALRKALAGGGFSGTPFGQRVAESYRDGAGFVFAADLEKIASRPNAAHHNDRPGFDQLKYAVLEQKAANGRTDTHAVLAFRGARHGLAALLGKPAAIGALDYISPEAGFATGFTLKNPAALLDELLASPEAREGLAKAEAEVGINIRNDVAASLGGEIAFALDGPALPVPSWKLVAEVYDPGRLQYSIQKLVEAGNRAAAQHGKTGAQLSQETVSGRTWYRIAVPGGQKFTEAYYTFADGYLVAAPTRALVERALGYRASGYTLTHSQDFAALLPRDRYADFSGIVYHNMGPMLGGVAGLLNSGKGLSAEQKKTVEGFAAEIGKPMLITFYGEDDRITLASTGSLLGLTPGNLVRLASPLGLMNSFGKGHAR